MSDESLTKVQHRVSSILHVQVGESGVWEPTTDQLDALVSQFVSAVNTNVALAVVATRKGVTAQCIHIPDTDAAILHVEAGAPGWEPLPSELKDLTDLFEKAATSDGSIAVVATRTGVTAHVVDLSNPDSEAFPEFLYDTDCEDAS